MIGEVPYKFSVYCPEGGRALGVLLKNVIFVVF